MLTLTNLILKVVLIQAFNGNNYPNVFLWVWTIWSTICLHTWKCVWTNNCVFIYILKSAFKQLCFCY